MKRFPILYWVSDGGRGEPKQVGRVTPCAPLCPPISRRARSDAPYPPSLRHYPIPSLVITSLVLLPKGGHTPHPRLPSEAEVREAGQLR